MRMQTVHTGARNRSGQSEPVTGQDICQKIAQKLFRDQSRITLIIFFQLQIIQFFKLYFSWNKNFLKL